MDAIFLMTGDGKLEKVPQTPYATEDLLQELIERHPELIVGEQVDPEEPPRWLLVRREAGVPDAEGAPDRWFLDHLLLDQHGVPTLVEAKRSSNPEIRRQVVGQMLDYAANATQYWPVDRIRALAAAQAGGEEQLEQQVCDLVDPVTGETDTEAYWGRVEENLRAGRLRLLFVADTLPRELRRVIEFLNEHMPKIDVLGVEVRQYAGQRIRALVPRIVGQTERARDGKTARIAAPRLDEAGFLEACPEPARTFMEELLQQARGEGLEVRWPGKNFGIAVSRPGGKPFNWVYCAPPGIKNSGTAHIALSVQPLVPAEEPETLRRTLVGLGFSERGRYNLRLLLTEQNLPQARAALPHLWKVFRQIQENAAPDGPVSQ